MELTGAGLGGRGNNEMAVAEASGKCSLHRDSRILGYKVHCFGAQLQWRTTPFPAKAPGHQLYEVLDVMCTVIPFVWLGGPAVSY